MYGSQLITVLAQFAYAAVTSRLVDPAGFGAYAIALSVSGLVTLLATGGIAQSVARMADVVQERMQGLVTFAALLGASCATFVYLTAPFWAGIWGEEEAIGAIQFLSVAVLLAPLSGVGTNLMRRQGSFRLLAGITLTSNIVGMIVGAIVVFRMQSASALVVSAIVAQGLILVGSLLTTRRVMWGFGSIRSARTEVAFSGRLSIYKLSEYLVFNIMKFSVSRWLGASMFGHWNRADTLATLPFHQVQTALLQAVGPEFRHDIDNPNRAVRVWSDLLVLVAWVTVPVSVLAAIVLPGIVPLFFGPGWEIAAVLSSPLAIAAGLQTVSLVLSTAVESLGRFKWLWITSTCLIVVQVISAMALFVFRDIAIAMICLIATPLIRHGLQVFICGRHGYLDVRGLVASYWAVMVFSLGVGAVAWLVRWLVLLIPDVAFAGISAVGVCVLAAVALWLGRNRLPPIRLARTYGLYGAD